ncbi:MAG: hypothetical protein U5Q44_11225 [Dehalococcoidia bacterium]|nr:hypothetical protein [Dehalococcoidia bacterium]
MTPESSDLDPQGILLEVATLIAERQSVSSVFAAFAERILDLADFDFASLLTWDEGQGVFRPVGYLPSAAAGRSRRSANLRTAAMSTPGISPSFEDGIMLPDGRGRCDGQRRSSCARAGMDRVWSIAIRDGDLVVGIMTIARRAGRDFAGAGAGPAAARGTAAGQRGAGRTARAGRGAGSDAQPAVERALGTHSRRHDRAGHFRTRPSDAAAGAGGRRARAARARR